MGKLAKTRAIFKSKIISAERKRMSTAIEKYLTRLKESFPNFQNFGNGSEAFDKEERDYKIELVELYRSTVAESLSHFPADEQSQIAIGKNISALFTARLQSAGNKPQNLVGYRYFDPLKFEGSNYAKWAQLVKNLTDSEGQLCDRVDKFVGGLYELIKKKVLNNKIAFSALSRSVTSLLLMLSDPTKHAIVKTQEFNRAMKAFGKVPMTSEPLSGQEYTRVQEFLYEVNAALLNIGITPRDMIDVQSFIWVGDGKTYQSSEQYWLLGANWDGDDKTSIFVAESRWENGYEDKLLDRVRKVKSGDRVAIKSTYTRKLDLPFNSRGKTISCMDIKARGIVKKNPGDGRHLEVEWETDFEPRTIYFYTYRSTIDLIDKAKYKGTTVAWVFGDLDQDVDWLEEQALLLNQDAPAQVNKIVGSLNRILYGPPGTGKTFRTVNEALSILDPEFLQVNVTNRTALKERFDELVSLEDIRFVTFHQSFSYEDFVEGLRPVTDGSGNLTYKVESGVFKSICKSAQVTDSPMTLGQVENASTSSPNGKIKAGDALNETYVIGKVTSDVVFVKKKKGASVPFAWELLETLAELVRNNTITLDDIRKKRVFEKVPDVQLEKYLVNGYENILFLLIGVILKAPVVETLASGTPKVLIIDEINRGNVSRIFGELITLIEKSKRGGNPEALEVTLPYSKERFTIPNNVYLIGTMNTADRSLTGLDIALRRRFTFIEILPQPEQLDGVEIGNINVGALLRSMNERIEVLLDRDHCLGHTYFLDLVQTPTLSLLAAIFREQVVPLLEEYFFEDWERIHFVLNDHRKEDQYKFILRPKSNMKAIFGEDKTERFQDNRWVVNPNAFDLHESYIQVYEA